MKLTSNTFRAINGFSLIEMMVSMVLGLFLLGGLITVYINSKGSDKVRAEITEMESNARLALNALRLNLQHAGYKSIENVPRDKPFHTSSDGLIENQFCRDGGVMVLKQDLLNPPAEFQGYTVDTPLGDRVTAVYRADNPDRGPVIFDCAGGNLSVAASTQADNRARQIACSTDPDSGMNNPWQSYIYSGFYVKQSDKTLRCYGSRTGEDGSLIVAENIENMQLRYGVTVDEKTTYKNATDVENNSEWESVSSVQVALLVRSNKGLKEAETQHFQLLDESVTKSDDKYLYRVYSTTINLPNRKPREL